ncbi:hypothetical protein LDENG_00198370 [Lucifuga dentata]|nr:hypothetical protein LDENG_00198370 [Lucifuga dentata]
MKLFFLLGVILVVKAQTPTEPNYEDFLLKLNFPLQNYQPLLNQVQVETPEEADLPSVSVRSLTFPAQETECNATQEQAKPCPLKKNGKVMLCYVKVSFTVQEVDDIRAFEMSCDTATTEDVSLKKVRTRRSRGSKSSSRSGNRGGGRGSRGRTGRGSSIAGSGNRSNSGTRTA